MHKEVRTPTIVHGSRAECKKIDSSKTGHWKWDVRRSMQIKNGAVFSSVAECSKTNRIMV